MLGIGSLVFATPWVLLGLISLPIIFWLLRITPPAPRRLRFPAIRLLYDLVTPEETPQHTPWWLLLLRLALAAVIVLALARPLINPGAALPGDGPIVVVMDNGWAAARDWPARRTAYEDVLDKAERQGRPVVVLPTAATPGEPIRATGLLQPEEARTLTTLAAAQPWPTDRTAAVAALDALELEPGAHAVWLSDGLDGPGAQELGQRLDALGGLEIMLPAIDRLPHLLMPPATEGADLVSAIVRSPGPLPEQVAVRATATDGRLLGREVVTLPPDSAGAEIRLALPAELRNEAMRLDIEDEPTAGSVVLLDERWRRRPVGIVAPASQAEAQPLLADAYYLTRALEPFADVRRGSAAELIESGLAVLVLPDSGTLAPEELTAVQDWIGQGGVLLRFAGPLLAANPDDLVPTPLRFGDRILSGALAWTEPMPLAPFDAASPFAGLPVPDDVRVERQVLAEPTLDLGDKTWARLADGTPIVTAAQDGDGWLVLVHTTAGPDWSNLPISGLYVELLRRIVGISQGVAGAGGSAPLPALETLDGFGRLGAAPPTALPLAAGAIDPTVDSDHPPGFYGTAEARRALNLGPTVESLAPLTALPATASIGTYAAAAERDLMPWLLAAALVIALIDLVIAFAMRGLLRLPRRAGAAAGGLALLLLLPREGDAQGDDAFAMMATGQTYLAYVETGNSAVDEASRAGLEGLSNILINRTAVEAAGAVGIDPAVDELAFFPLLYWPVVESQPDLSAQAVTRLNAYLHSGGTILFDTRDQAYGAGADLLGGGPGTDRLRTLTRSLDVPPLVPVPPEHVLTRAFYLLQDFPGRYAGGRLWVEASDAHVNDGVSSVIIGGNDWAGAWAVGGDGAPVYPVVPGGERQREMAFRFGVNLVMYALTGNYKADQVHVPAILERLGQ